MSTVADMTPANDVNATGPMALEDAKHAWLTDAEHAISALAVRNLRTNKTFTADDVRAIIGSPDHPAWWGVAFSNAKRRKEIEVVGFTVATAKSRNGSIHRVWKASKK